MTHANRVIGAMLSAIAVAACSSEPAIPEPIYGETMLEPEWVLVPAGTYLMGSPEGERWESERMRVTISRPFWMQSTEVTAAEYARNVEEYMATGAGNIWGLELYWREKSLREGGWGPRDLDLSGAVFYTYRRNALEGLEQCYRLDLCPVPESVHSENEYADFLYSCIDWAIQNSGPECSGYRLPTEAEWEWAARGAGANDCANGGRCLRRYAWYRGNSWEELPQIPFADASVVAQLRPNALGLYDMLGNKLEWTSDALMFRDDPYYYGTDLVDPVRPMPELVVNADSDRPYPTFLYYMTEDGLQPWRSLINRVVRGGSINDEAEDVTVWRQGRQWPASRGEMGVRLVRTAYDAMPSGSP